MLFYRTNDKCVSGPSRRRNAIWETAITAQTESRNPSIDGCEVPRRKSMIPADGPSPMALNPRFSMNSARVRALAIDLAVMRLSCFMVRLVEYSNTPVPCIGVLQYQLFLPIVEYVVELVLVLVLVVVSKRRNPKATVPVPGKSVLKNGMTVLYDKTSIFCHTPSTCTVQEGNRVRKSTVYSSGTTVYTTHNRLMPSIILQNDSKSQYSITCTLNWNPTSTGYTGDSSTRVPAHYFRENRKQLGTGR